MVRVAQVRLDIQLGLPAEVEGAGQQEFGASLDAEPAAEVVEAMDAAPRGRQPTHGGQRAN